MNKMSTLELPQLPTGFINVDPSPLKRQPPPLQSRPKRAKWYSVKIQSSPDEEKDEDVPVLILKHFSSFPYVCFDKVKIGTSKTCTLHIKNPCNETQKVNIEKFPHKKGFAVDYMNFIVDSNEDMTFNITWTPSEAENCREIVIFRTSTGCKTQAILLGNAVCPPSNKKKLRERRVAIPKVKSKEIKLQPFNLKPSIFSDASQHNILRNFANKNKENGSVEQDKLCDNFLLTVCKTNNLEGDNTEHTMPHTPVRRQTFFVNGMEAEVARRKTRTILQEVPFNEMEEIKDNIPDYSRNRVNFAINSPKRQDKCCIKKMSLTSSLGDSSIKSAEATNIDIRRATFVKKAIQTDCFNDSLNPSPESSPLEDSLISAPEKVADNCKNIETLLDSSKNIPTDVSCITFRNVSKTAENSQFYLGDVPVTETETFEVDNFQKIQLMFPVSSHGKERLQSDRPKENNNLHKEAIVFSSKSEKTSLNANFSSPAAKQSFCELQNKSITDSGKDQEHLSSSSDLQRLSTETSILAEPLIPSHLLPHYSCSGEKSDVREKGNGNKLLQSAEEVIKTPLVTKHSEMSDSSKFSSFHDLAIECSILPSETPLEIRRCSTGIKPNPPKLQLPFHHLSSCHEYFPSEVAEPLLLSSTSCKQKKISSNAMHGVATFKVKSDPIIARKSAANLGRMPKSLMTISGRSKSKNAGPKRLKTQCEIKADRGAVDLVHKTVIKSPKKTYCNELSSVHQNQDGKNSSAVKHIEKQRLQFSPQRDSRRIIKNCTTKARGKLDSAKGFTRHSPIKALKPKIQKVVRGVPQARLTLIKPIKTTVARHPNPYAAKNMYYDERWMEKQELAFARWFNFIFTPPDDLTTTNEIVKVDAAKLWVESMKSVASVRAPTKEDVSLKAYTALRRLNRLRKAACLLYQSAPVVTVIKRLEIEIEARRLLVRKDRAMHADLGMKQKILDLLLCYNPLWLRVGLETIYGEIMPIQSNSDIIGLSRFIVHRLLNSPDIAAKYAHPSVPHLFKPGFEEELKKFTLKKFLLLVLFLDSAKLTRLIDHDPCLFCKNAEYKSSRDLLLAFSRDFLSGEGDVTRHLRYLGYSVSHHQTALEEFDYAVTNISVDLRCGLRLGRLLELLLQRWGLSAFLRVPAISRLQKIHNTDVALNALISAGYTIEGGITSRDIVDGHREKTLNLIWQIIFKTQVEKLLNKKKLSEEIAFLKRNLELKAQIKAFNAAKEDDQKVFEGIFECGKLYENSESLTLLLQWCQAVSAHYGIKVLNFTVSFADGKVLCYLLHHYHPAILPSEAVKQNTTLSYLEEKGKDNVASGDDSFDDNWTFSNRNGISSTTVMEELLSNEKENLKLAFDKFQELGGVPIVTCPSDMCNTIPDEKVVITLVTYLNARLMDLSQEIRAARIIQLAWRKKHLHKQLEKRKAEEKAAITIQRAIRKFLAQKILKRQQVAATLIQSIWRMFKAKEKLQMLRYQKRMKYLETKAVVIQAAYRGYREREHLKRMTRAAVLLQSLIRKKIARSHYLCLRKHTIQLQQYYRANKIAHKERHEYLAMKKSVILWQSIIRGWLVRKHISEQNKAAIVIQAAVKKWIIRRHYLQVRSIIVKMQQRYRGKMQSRKCRYQFQKMQQAAKTIQRWYKACIVRKEFKKLKSAAITIQTFLRGCLVRKHYNKLKFAAVTIQLGWRAVLLSRRERKQYLVTRQSIVILQCAIKRFLAVKEFKLKKKAAITLQKYIRGALAKYNFHRTKRAATCIQRWWQATMLARKVRKNYQEQLHATIILQSLVRMYSARKRFLKLKTAVKIIESRRIANCQYLHQRRKYLMMKKDVVLLQAVYRGYTVRKRMNILKEKAVIIQTAFRGFVLRKKYLEKRKAVLCIQKYYRAYIITCNQQREYQRTRNGFIKLQAIFRGNKMRKKIKKWHESAIKIQCEFRGFIVRKKYLKKRNAVLCIQKCFQAHIITCNQQREYQRMRNGFIKLQAVFRGNKTRKEIKRWHESAIRIQAAFKGWKTRKLFLQLKNKCILIQQHYRGNLMMKFQLKAYKEIRKAAIVVQKYYRVYSARKEFRRLRATVLLQSYVRQFIARRNYLRLRTASITIQAYVRMYFQREHYRNLCLAVLCVQRHFQAKCYAVSQRNIFLKKKKSCIVLQSHVKSMIARKAFIQKKRACIAIQSFVRMHQQRKRYLQLYHSTVAMQRIFRGKCLTQIKRNTFLETRNTCIKMQSLIRMKQQRKWYMAFHKSVCIVQQKYREKCISRKERERYLKLRNACIILQAFARKTIAKRKFRKQKHACTVIQAHIRKFIAKKKYTQTRKAAIFLQKHYRTWVVGREQRHCYLELKQSTIIIQSFFRGFLVRQRLIKETKACILIQSHVKGCIVRRKFLECRKAAVVIQQHYQALKIGKDMRLTYLVTKRKVLVIQAFTRGWLVRQSLKRQHHAANIIQTWVRTQQARNMFIKKRQAAVTIQRCFRNWMISKQIYHSYMKTRKTVICIQATWRGCRARNEYKKLRAVVKLQALIRRNIAQKDFLRMKRSIVTIQSFIKGHLARKHYLEKQKNIILIQRYWRAKIAGHKAWMTYQEEKKACIRIQAWWRGCSQRKLLCLQHTAASKIQAGFLAWKVHRQFLILRKSVIAIQKYWRAVQTMRVNRKEFTEKCSAAICIQNSYRKYIVRKKSAIIIQSMIRCFIVRYKYLQLKKATIKIQAWYRGINERRKFFSIYQATLTLQLHLRAYIIGMQERKKYLQVQSSAITLQSYARGYIARKLLNRHLAARTIQTWYRGIIQRQHYFLLRQKTIFIQALFRGHVERQRFVKLKASVISQRNLECILAEREQHYREQIRETAAICIQRTYRAYAENQRRKLQLLKEEERKSKQLMFLHHVSALRIQRCYHHYKLKQLAKKQLPSVLIIQQWFRAYLQRRWFLKLKSSVHVFQRAAQCYLKKRCRAAIVIQSHVRSWLVRQRMKKENDATVVIQAAWRGYKVRCRNQTKFITQARTKIRNATAKATDDMKLGNRTTTALDFLLKYQSLRHLLTALIHLDVATRLSAVCCERMVEAGGLPILLRLIHSCNRSVPHMEIIKYSANILLNIAKYEKTVIPLWEIEGSVETILELMRIFREKGSSIFTKACTLLWILCQEPCRAQAIRTNRNITDKICSLHYLTTRKQKMEDDRLLAKAKMSASASASFLSMSVCSISRPREHVKIQPDWVLGKQVMREFKDPSVAITSVMRILGLKKK